MFIFFVKWKNTRNAFYKTGSARNSCSKRNIDRSKSALAETDRHVYILRPKMWKNTRDALLKCVRLVILARKGISIVARVRRQKQTRYELDMCIFFVLNVEKHQERKGTGRFVAMFRSLPNEMQYVIRELYSPERKGN